MIHGQLWAKHQLQYQHRHIFINIYIYKSTEDYLGLYTGMVLGLEHDVYNVIRKPSLLCPEFM